MNIGIKTKKKKTGKILTKNTMGSRKVTIDRPLYRTLFWAKQNVQLSLDLQRRKYDRPVITTSFCSVVSSR